MLLLFFAGLGLTGYMYVHVPTAFVPSEDQNYLIVAVQAPQGASLSYTTDVSSRAEQMIRQDPDVFATFAVPGFSLSGGSSSNSGLIFVPLKPIDSRLGAGTWRAGYPVAPAAQALPDSGRDPGLLRASGDSGYRLLWRLSVHSAGPGPQHSAESGRCHQPNRRRQQEQQPGERALHQLYGERSPAAGQYRSQESRCDGSADQSGFVGAGRLHGFRNTSTISTSTIVRTGSMCRQISRSA